MDKNRLKEITTAAGLSTKEAGILMMCSENAARDKLNGKHPMTVEEARSIVYGLNMTIRQIMECFFEE